MSEFIDGLGKNAAVGDVFAEIYGQVNGLVLALDGLRVAEHGERTSDKTITGLPVSLNWMSYRHGGFGEPWSEDSTSTTYVDISVGWRDTLHLLGRSIDNVRGEHHPSGAMAYRGAESSGDYRIKRSVATSDITVTLGNQGYWQTGKRPEDTEPIGVSRFDSKTRAKTLKKEDRHRLDTVAQTIVDRVLATERIIKGGDPRSVLEANGMLIANSDY